MAKPSIINGVPASLTGCCLCCNDLQINHDAKTGFFVTNGCPACQADILDGLKQAGEHREPGFVNSQPTNVADCIQAIDRALSKARFPLICGLSDQSFQAQQAAVSLARRSDAVIDWTVNNVPEIIHRAFQETGWVSCTFGEIHERSDLMVSLVDDLTKDHPGFSRQFAQNVRPVSFDGPTDQIKTTLRRWRGEKTSPNDNVIKDCDELKNLIDAAKYPVLVVDNDWVYRHGAVTLGGLFRFVREQNKINHCRLIHLAPPGLAGIQSAMTSLAGFPFAVAFRDQGPVFRPVEFAASRLLSEHQTDVVFLVGSAAQIPVSLRQAVGANSNVVKIHICDRWSASEDEFQADIRINTARWGVESDGLGIRSDGVPVQRSAIVESQFPTTCSVIEQVMTDGGLATP